MSNDKTISEAGQAWLKQCKLNELERATLRSYESHLRLHIEPQIGQMLLDELTAEEVRNFIDDVMENKTSAMAVKVLGSLRSILATAQERGWVVGNVARQIRLHKSRRRKKERIIPTKDEIRMLLRKAPARHKPFVTTAIFTGMRASELRGLKWESIDFEKGLIRVKERADRFNEFDVPKSEKGKRYIPMSPEVQNLLTAWKKKCPSSNLGLVFPNGAGNVETHSNIYNRVFKPLMIECKLVDAEGKPKFGFHSLRHATASLLIDGKWEPKRIQTIMGHSSISMTFDVYGHLFEDPEADVEAMASIESNLFAA